MKTLNYFPVSECYLVSGTAVQISETKVNMDSKRSFLSLLNNNSDPGTSASSKAISPEAEASERLRSMRSQDLMTKPLFAEKNKEDCESAPSAEQDSLDSTFPDIPEPDSPEASMTPRLRRMAASLGCEPEVGSPAWERSLETPEAGIITGYLNYLKYS